MRQSITRRDAIRGMSTVGVAGLAGCIGGISGGGRQIKYGVLLPLTGDLGSLGTPMRDAGILPGKQLNAADAGRTIDWQEQDTATDPSQAVSGANALVNAGYPGVCGPAASDSNIQTTNQVFVPNRVVNISPSSTNPAVSNLDDEDYNFRTAPSDALQGRVLAQVARERLNAQTAATMYVNNDYGQALSEEFVGGFEERGGRVQRQVAFPKQQPSYTARIRSAVERDPDVLVVIGYPESGVQLFKDYFADFESERGLLVTDGLRDTKLTNEVGERMRRVVGTVPKPAGPNVRAFNQLYREEYDTDPSAFNAHTYDAAAVLILANAAAGENDGRAVRSGIRKVANPPGTAVGPGNLAEGLEMAAAGDDINYQGASSSVDFDENGDMTAVAYSVWQFAPGRESGFRELDTVDFGG